MCLAMNEQVKKKEKKKKSRRKKEKKKKLKKDFPRRRREAPVTSLGRSGVSKGDQMFFF